MLMSSLRDLGSFPFPHVELTIKAARWLATVADMEARETFHRNNSLAHEQAVAEAQRWIYEKHYAINSKKVEELLKDHSWTPTVVSLVSWTYAMTNTYVMLQNAFSRALWKHGFNYHDMVVVDLMHEFELGVWKAIFLHLLRIVYAHGGAAAIAELDHR
jgi:hypothetical protein